MAAASLRSPSDRFNAILAPSLPPYLNLFSPLLDFTATPSRKREVENKLNLPAN